MAVIDVGHACADLPHFAAINNTVVTNENPANDAGTIDYICCYVNGNGTFQFGTMTNTGGTTYDTNGESGNLSVVSGLNEFNAPGDFTAFAVASGDYCGVYCGGQNIRTRNYGTPTGSGYKKLYGDKIGLNGQNFGADVNAYDVAVRFTGATTGGPLEKDLDDTINISDVRVFLLGLDKSDSISLSDSPAKNIGRPLTDSISISDGIAKNVGLAESDTITMSDGITKTPGLSRADTITLSDNASKVASFLRSLNDTITLSDNITKEIGLSRADTVQMTDNLTNMIKAIMMALNDTMNLSDNIVKNVGTVQSDTINLTDGATKGFGTTKADTITMSDNLVSTIIAIIININDTINLSDGIVKSVGTFRADTINLSDNFGKVISYLRSFADTITLSDLGLREAGLNKADTITLSDSMIREPRLSKADTVTLSDSIAKELGLSRADTITLSDFFSSDAGIVWTNIIIKGIDIMSGEPVFITGKYRLP